MILGSKIGNFLNFQEFKSFIFNLYIFIKNLFFQSKKSFHFFHFIIIVIIY